MYPRISIVTPSFNQAQFLEKTILSVLNQNYPHLEYIIIDGGSTDGSVEIIKKYKQSLAYWVSEKDNGQSHAIKKGFEKASGEIFGWLNSDDMLLPGSLSNVAREFKKDSGLDLIYSNVIYIDHNDNYIGERRFIKISQWTLLTDCGICQPAAFWTRRIYLKAGGIDPKWNFCMDYDLFVRITGMGKVKLVKDYFAAARLHKDTKTGNLHHVYIREREQIRSKYHPYYDNKPVFFLHRLFSRFYRLIRHFLQGDSAYLAGQCINKIKR